MITIGSVGNLIENILTVQLRPDFDKVNLNANVNNPCLLESTGFKISKITKIDGAEGGTSIKWNASVVLILSQNVFIRPCKAQDARAIETATGKSLYKAYQRAPETTSRLAPKHNILAEIQKRADERFPAFSSPERRFAHAIDTDKYGRPYDKVAHMLYQTSKGAPGSDVAPLASEEPEDFVKADAASRGSAHAQMLELARAHNAANPKLSPEQSYAAVYTDRANVGLKNRMSDESWSLQNVGDVRYAEQMRAPYTNPHPGGSGKRPSAKSLDEQVPRARFDMLPDPTVGAVRASPGRN